MLLCIGGIQCACETNQRDNEAKYYQDVMCTSWIICSYDYSSSTNIWTSTKYKCSVIIAYVKLHVEALLSYNKSKII